MLFVVPSTIVTKDVCLENDGHFFNFDFDFDFKITNTYSKVCRSLQNHKLARFVITSSTANNSLDKQNGESVNCRLLPKKSNYIFEALVSLATIGARRSAIIFDNCRINKYRISIPCRILESKSTMYCVSLNIRWL